MIAVVSWEHSMNKRPLSDWASIAEIIASLSVVISLLFVGVQLHENTTEMRASQSNDLYDAIREVELTVLSNSHLMGAVDKGMGGRRSEMSEEEITYFRNYLVQSFTIWEQAFSRANDGLMSSENYLGWEGNFSVYIRQGVTPEDLDYMLPFFDEQFTSKVIEVAKSLED
jgi:hypothetical protein